MKKYKKILIICLIFILLISYLVNFISLNKNLINDYYYFINKDILEKNDIENNEIGWSKFSLAQKKVDNDVDVIVKDLVDNKMNADINVFYNNILDIEARDKVGLGILNNYISLIDSSKNINEFIKNAILIENELYIDIFTLATVAPDFKNTNENIVYFYPIRFDFGMNSDVYVDEDYSRYHALVKQYQIKLLKLYGYDKTKARNVSKMLDDFFIDIANKSKKEAALSDVDTLYNIITKEELQNIYTNLDINYYLKLMGIDDENYFSIVDVENYKAINSYLTNENLYLLKEYVKIKILENYGSYTSINYAKTINDLNNKLMGVESDINLENMAIDMISSVFSSTIDKIYLESHFSQEDALFIENMVLDIISYYEDNINSNTWLDSSTKDKAILKLKNMKINIGGSYDCLVTYNLKEFNVGSSLVENILVINRKNNDILLSDLKNNNIKSIISPTMVNAYYNPLDNSINFPAALKELYSSKDDYYKVLGSMGMIIAHEITHAFDNSGSKFDEFGNRVDWWCASDYSKFNDLQQDIIDYYSNYEVLGVEVDGFATVGENIADLGAINAIVGVAKKKSASEADFKMMFSSYASLWASEYVESYQKLLLLSDVHSPDKIRVNAVLSSIDEFYQVYNIKKDDDMYIDKKFRVKIW